MESSYCEISKNLCLSLGTAHNHFKRHLIEKPLSDYDELTVVEVLLDDPSMYLSEVC